MCCSAATPASLGTMPATIPSLPMLAVPLTLLVGQVDVKLQGGSTPTPASQNALAWILQSASAINAASPASSSRVLIGPGLPTISKQLLDRKQKWEYVDIWWTCFHPRAPMTRLWGCTHPPPPSALHTVSRLRRPCKTQADLEHHPMGAMFHSVYSTARYPSATLELLAYMLTIIKAS